AGEAEEAEGGFGGADAAQLAEAGEEAEEAGELGVGLGIAAGGVVVDHRDAELRGEVALGGEETGAAERQVRQPPHRPADVHLDLVADEVEQADEVADVGTG